MQYFIEVAISILTGVVTGLGLMASNPDAPIKSALVAGGLAGAGALLQALRALKQTPPSEHKPDA